MRHGWTIVPAGLVLAAALIGAGDPGSARPDGVHVLDDHFGMRIMPIYLLLRPDVQADLELNRRQITGARELVGQLIERGLRLKSLREQAARAERREIDEEMAGWFQRELTAVQQERLTQISLQWEGASALRRTVVADYLGLDTRQRAQLERMLSDRDGRRAAGSLTAAEFDRFTRLAMSVLTKNQKEQWDAVLGRPCQFVIGQRPEVGKPPAPATPVKAQPGPSAASR